MCVTNSYCGPGGDRTLVQTGKQYAFYTLSFLLGCRVNAGAETALANTVSSKSSSTPRGWRWLSPICCATGSRSLGENGSWVTSRSCA